MWCDKCHYGSESVKWKLDASGNFNCPQCGTLKPPLNRSPFGSKPRTLGGRSVSEKPLPKKFTFDQKGGSNTDNTYESSKDLPTYKDKPTEQSAEKTTDKMVQDAIKQAVASEKSVEQPKSAEQASESSPISPEQPVERPIQQPVVSQAETK